MNLLPAIALTAAQQRKLSGELYRLLDQQVKSYHAHHHMGANSSVSTETAQELLRSIWYTIDAFGGYDPALELKAQLERGQAILEQRLEKCRETCRLVYVTAPAEANPYRWQTMQDLDRYLQNYDHRHTAHQDPGLLDYPLLAQVPEQLAGIDLAQFWLNCLWAENQILDAFPERPLQNLYERMPPDYWEAPQNLCEQPLFNGIGRALLELDWEELTLSPAQLDQLCRLLRSGSAEGVRMQLTDGLCRLCAGLKLPEGAVREYAAAVIQQLLPRLLAALPGGDLSCLFL